MASNGFSALALAGVVLPLLLIGATPWLAWLYPLLGPAGASYFLGIVEIAVSLPVLEPNAVRMPMLNAIGQFLIKDIALLGVSLVITSEPWARVRAAQRGDSKELVWFCNALAVVTGTEVSGPEDVRNSSSRAVLASRCVLPERDRRCSRAAQ